MGYCASFTWFTPAWLALLTRTVINRVSELSGSGWQNWQPIAVPAVALALVMLAGEAANRLAWWASTNQNELVQEALTLQVQAQALRLDMQYYDSADYYDMLHRAGRVFTAAHRAGQSRPADALSDHLYFTGSYYRTIRHLAAIPGRRRGASFLYNRFYPGAQIKPLAHRKYIR